MNRCILLLLVFCAVAQWVTADRRRPDHDQRTRYRHHDDDDDGDEPQMAHLADFDSNAWRHEHSTWRPKDNKHLHDHQPATKGQWKGKDQKKEYKNQRNNGDLENEDMDRRRGDGNRHRGEANANNGRNQTPPKDSKKKSNEQQGYQDRHDNRNRDHTHESRSRQHSQERTSLSASPSDFHHPEVHTREPENVHEILTDTASSDGPSTTSNSPNPAGLSPVGEVATAPPSWSGDPPPHEDVAAMARYIVHVSDWAAMATISTRPNTLGAPFANVFSVADGTKYRSSGIPYMYLTDWEMSVKDLREDNRASLTMSLAQSAYCETHAYDPESPLCAHVILSGTVRQMDESEDDYTFAKDALFARHPAMAGWPTSHEWFVALLEIDDIIVLDYFGGAITVTKDVYFAASPFTVKEGRASNSV